MFSNGVGVKEGGCLSVGDFVFLTDANELTRTQKYRVAFQK
jgi:hypothetical protein